MVAIRTMTPTAVSVSASLSPTRPHRILTALLVCSLIILNDPSHHQATALNFGKKKNNNSNNSPQSDQQIQDAAMGTVTSLEPGREKEPVTCDEIMAKSVVIANEAKATAMVMKESAMQLAESEGKRADELAEKIEGSLARVKEVEGEMEELRRSTAETVEEKGRAAGELIEQKRSEADRDIEKVRKEMEAFKLTTEKTVDEKALAADAAVEQTKKQAAASVQKIETQMEELRLSSAQTIEEKEKAAGALVEQKKAEADAEIEKIVKEMADLKLATAQAVEGTRIESTGAVAKAEESLSAARLAAQEQIDEHKLAADARVKRIEGEAAAKVDQITKESDEAIAKAQEEKLAAQEASKNEADAKVGKAERDAEERVRQIEEQLAALKQSSAALIETTKKEAAELGETTKSEASAEISEAKKQATEDVENANERTKKITNEAEAEIKSVRDEARLLVTNTSVDAEKKQKETEDRCKTQIKDITTKTTAEVNQIKEEMKSMKAKAESEILSVKDETSKKIDGIVGEKKEVQKNMGDKFKVQKNHIALLEKAIKDLQNDLQNTNEDLQYWKIVHDTRTYINATHVIEDVSTILNTGLIKARAAVTCTLQESASVVKSKCQPIAADASDLLDLYRTKLSDFWQPHGEKLSLLYDTHLKETVDNKLMPAVVPPYQKFVVPRMKSATLECISSVETIKAKCILSSQHTKEALVNLFVTASEVLREVFIFLRNFLIEKDERTVIPAFILQLLQNVADNASWWLSVYLKIMAALAMYMCRSIIFKLMLRALLIPFQIIKLTLRVPFIPFQIIKLILRPLIGKTEKKPKIEAKKQKASTRKRNK